MDSLIRIATEELARFLSEHLPALGEDEDWWERLVEHRLSFQQQRMVQERKLTTLRQLDFAALLRVLDQNWNDLSQMLNLPREGRTWVKELQTVRNNWAHPSGQAMPADDIYRAADTFRRFLNMLDATPKSVAAIEAARTDALAAMVTAQGVAVTPSDPAAATSEQAGEKIGQRDRESLPQSPEQAAEPSQLSTSGLRAYLINLQSTAQRYSLRLGRVLKIESITSWYNNWRERGRSS